MDSLIEQAAADIARARLAVALTGAGISVESGIPPFRGKGGLWERFDPMEIAHIDALTRNPARVWDLLVREMKGIVDTAQPHAGHTGLADLESLGRLSAVITQNVDGLHHRAGSRDVIEFHGNFAWQRCMDCPTRIPTEEVSLDELPPRCSCGGVLRPDCVFFGEMIPTEALNRSRQLACTCDLMLVVGTSALVEPAASLPRLAKSYGAKVIEINMEKTPLTDHVADYSIFGAASRVMDDLVKAVRAHPSLA